MTSPHPTNGLLRPLRETALSMTLVALCAASAPAQFDFDEEPIRYSTAAVSDAITKLNESLERGTIRLERNAERGYLDSVLELLGIPAASQVLVFSKTSFQRELISPRNPRALYFSDGAYVGWVRGGKLMEVTAIDSRLGPIFYTLSQEPSERPRFERHDAECLQCHASSLTRGVPGLVVRSVHPGPDGQPILKAGTFTTDHSSPLRERWGGWYVTGSHGSQVHLGNATLRDEGRPELLAGQGSNVLELGSHFEETGYLTPHSDIVALMVLEHQAQMHNWIVRASYQARIALRDQDAMSAALGEPAGKAPTESTIRRFEYAALPLLKYLLLVDEARLTEPIRGTSSFAKTFSEKGPRDSRGRSLHDLDLSRRLFKHPCSFLIYSDSIRQLPGPLRDHLYRRLFEILTGKDTSKDFASLTTGVRQAVLEILVDTDPELPDYWRKNASRRL